MCLWRKLTGFNNIFFSLLRLHMNVNSSLDRLSVFIFNEWKFHADKTDKLQKWLSTKDQENYNVSLDNLVWTEIFKMMIIGTRIYLNKEPLKNLEAARKKNQMWVEHFLKFSNLFFLIICFFQVEKASLWRSSCWIYDPLDSIFLHLQYFLITSSWYNSINLYWLQLYLSWIFVNMLYYNGGFQINLSCLRNQ